MSATSDVDIKLHTEWLEMGSENPWLIDGVLHEACTLLYARQKQAKSLLTTDLAHALMTGASEWLGRTVHGGSRRVAFAVSDPRAEMETSRRLAALKTPPTPVFRARRGKPPEYWNYAARRLTDDGVSVLIVDAGSNLVHDINSPLEVGQLMDGLNEVLDVGLTVLLVHHISGSRDAAGIYMWKSWPRQLIEMKRNGGQATLTFDGNDPSDVENLSLWLPKEDRPGSRFRLVDRGALEQIRTPDRISVERDLLAEMKTRTDWRSQEAIASALEISQPKVSRTLRRTGHMLRNGTVVPVTEAGATDRDAA